MEISGMVVKVKERKGTRYVLVPHAPTEEEQAMHEYLAALQRNVAAAIRFICYLEHPDRLAPVWERELETCLAAPRSRGIRARMARF